MLIKGFGFSGYRSFGDNLTKIAPLRKVNFIIGQNNTGKSNIINFLQVQYPYFVSKVNKEWYGGAERDIPFHEIDRHISTIRADHRISFPVLKNEVENYIKSKLPGDNQSLNRDLARKVLSSEQITDENGNIWFTYKSSSHAGNFSLEIDFDKVISVLNEREWHNLWYSITRLSGGNLHSNWVPETLNALAYTPSSIPNIEVIPAIRKVGAPGTEADDFSGNGIIERLAKIQNPPLIEQKEKSIFHRINTFLQEVLENKSANIEIPYDRDMILIHMDGKTLPLESLGTGVHEVIILAAAATILKDTVICVEEPELHLHPLLQKKLVKYLADSTSNQYFFTTHSAHLLDVVDSEILHVTHFNGVSSVKAIASTKEKAGICNDLGYKASDLLQANCIIWVEGPSDRVYLNYWISHFNADLVEGVHYSIMFYGGRLFSHITAMDDDDTTSRVEDFISVRSLNRNTVIMFDSDKPKPRSHLTPTKKRLKREFDQGPGFSWVTKGREIENYLDYDALKKSILAVHPSASIFVSTGQWGNLLKYKKFRTSKTYAANKVKVARHYVEHYQPNLESLDLKDRIADINNFILAANGL